MKIKILVIDNEQPIRKAMVKMIEHFNTDDQYVIFEAEGVRTGIDAIQQINPDILFLDIELDDGLAFDIFKEVNDLQAQLIFTTAHNHYAVRAFEYSALDYLLKPISPSLLNNVLIKAMQNIDKVNLKSQIQIMLDTINKNQTHEQKIALKDINGIKITKIKDILYCEANGPYTTFFIENEKEVTVSKNLKEYEVLLGALNFVRCHHSYLVNLGKVKSIDKTDGLTIHLENNAQIPISFRKKDEILNAIEKLYIS
ncbi:MAG: response regulator transcription factor [Saprospiraceae bacterium]|nr:response regulator transcription factor [Saprospiraceae bacterium]